MKIKTEDIVKVIALGTIVLLIGSLIYGIITGGADTSYLD